MRAFLLLFVLFFTSCVTNPSPFVKKSWYLNKSLIDFELNNGFCYKIKDNICYYRSDKASLIKNIFDDDYPYCHLAIYFDDKKIIRKIKILEDDIKCAYILR